MSAATERSSNAIPTNIRPRTHNNLIQTKIMMYCSPDINRHNIMITTNIGVNQDDIALANEGMFIK